MKIVFTDSRPLSELSDPKVSRAPGGIAAWVVNMTSAGHRIYVPEVIDYELRRELIRAGEAASLQELNAQKINLHYAPITTDAMLLAADLWARLRNSGQATGDPKKLDIDVILAAQALTEGRSLGLNPSEIIVATSNVTHLSRMVAADQWQNILP